ncbi:MAG: formylglycine-generating enzyme family protein [Cyanobium sp.]
MTTSASGPRTATFLLRQPRQVQGFHEPLAEGLALPLLWIPPGRFWMGSPESEAGRRADESPQHLVQLTGFFQGQTPITQAQWRAVAQWEPREGERWGKALSPNPSFFQQQRETSKQNGPLRKVADALVDRERSSATPTTEDDRRPVETVSWHDAMEFCSRLRQRTDRHYTLSSEAQWEYACRGGTTTPFAFGETITPELANYDCNYTYGQGGKGEYREQTTPVGMFPANAWGLQDMHGNVGEWCLDHWHESYEGAPEDGSAWLSEGEERRLVRGGSWFDDPRNCRSATRFQFHPGNAIDGIGFRVVCLPQGPSLNP